MKKTIDEKLDKYAHLAGKILRIGLGVLFIYAGYTKFADIGGTIGMFASLGIPAASFMTWLVAVVELGGGLLLIINKLARYSAILLGIILIVALITFGVPVIAGKVQGVMPIFSVKDIALLAATIAIALDPHNK